MSHVKAALKVVKNNSKLRNKQTAVVNFSIQNMKSQLYDWWQSVAIFKIVGATRTPVSFELMLKTVSFIEPGTLMQDDWS